MSARSTPRFRSLFSQHADAGMLALGIPVVAIHAAIFLRYMPNDHGLLGADYSLHFPNLLTGYYWFLQNGPLQIPWFSPAACGGFPYFPDPNVAYHSVPQWLVFVIEPLRALQTTFVLFALIGYCGCYVLMRRTYGASRPASVLAAVIFTFNGLYAYRMLAGHLTFHAFMLAPVVLAALLPHQRERYGYVAMLFRACIAGLCFAYMFQSGFVHGILPLVLATAVLLLLHGMLFGFQWRPWFAIFASGMVAIGLSAAKLASEVALLSQFPRDLYPLLGIEGFWNTLATAIRTVFSADIGEGMPPWKNASFAIERHELEYGVTFVPALLLVAASMIGAWRLAQGKLRFTPDRIVAAAAISVLLLVPIVINYYQEGWNAFLKGLPYFRNNFILLRWFGAYIPIAIVAGALCFDVIARQFSMSSRGAALFALYNVAVVALTTAQVDKHTYADQNYSPAPITIAWQTARETHQVAPIYAIVSGPNRISSFPNDSMVGGGSNLKCYQPLFGYLLERFTADPLQPGPIVRLIGDRMNLKNPACYLYPALNHCSPGDAFSASDIDTAMQFAHYRPISFVMPASLRIAGWVNLAVLGLVLLVLAVAGAHRARLRITRPSSGSTPVPEPRPAAASPD